MKPGRLVRHGYFERGVIEEDGENRRIKIGRVRCRNCRASHSLMPENLIPYKKYTVRALLQSVLKFVLGQKTYLDAVDEPVNEAATLFVVIENILRHLPIAARVLLENVQELVERLRQPVARKYRSRKSEKKERLQWLAELVVAVPNIFEFLNRKGYCIFGSGRGCELLRTQSSECKLF